MAISKQEMAERIWLDNTELDEAADLLEQHAAALEDLDPDLASCCRDTAGAFRRISAASLREFVDPGIAFPSILIHVRGTSEGPQAPHRVVRP